MDTHRFDTLARSVASGISRRSMLGRSARAALVSPLALSGMAAYADGNKKKDRDKTKDKDRNQGQGQVSGPITVNAPGGDAAASAQTVVQTNNQVCAGNCDQNTQQVVDTSLNQAVLAGSPTSALQPPTYWIDLSCNFDAPSYRTVCTGTAQGREGAPLVRQITLPRDRFCAVVLRTDSQPERRETVQVQAPVSSGNTNVANAGNGGVANANANGGSVTVGNVQGANDIAINASGGVANADASGGSGNVAIAGGQATQQTQTRQQVVQPSTLTIELEGNVAPGPPTTYWLETEAGRRPAAGPSLLQVADEQTETGTIVVDAWACPTAQPVDSYDWFGQCTTPAAGMQFSLFPLDGGTPLATLAPDAAGRVRFANLPAGVYEVRPEGPVWCHAESDHVDANGYVLVAPRQESHVWSFLCGGGS